jgi:hypothetical protein
MFFSMLLSNISNEHTEAKLSTEIFGILLFPYQAENESNGV